MPSTPLEDIAVIGMGCRFPGDARSPSEFFEMLMNKRSGRSEVPKDRFNVDAFWHPSYDRKGTIVSRGAHFLTEDVGLFDAPFFSMTQNESNAMDPQHRMLLEIAYECFENAGVPLHKVIGSETSCYVGGFTREYDTVTTTDLDDTLLYATTGNGLTMMSNRLSWFYDMRGESVSLDTACSSSLVALNLACRNIRASTSETRQSLVAGANLILVPDQMTTMNPLHFLSPDSQCYTFDDRANGYVRGEGFGVLLLKHIDDAIRDGDCIRGVIRNVACNQDGKTPGITLPSTDAQVSLMRHAYESAGLDPNVTGYFEAHGTGTAAGDPLEVAAIAKVFDRARSGSNPLIIGGVKPNIGHLEAGAGMAGLIKSLLILESGIIPPNINFERPNPRLALGDRNLKVVTEATPFPGNGIRRISVNSFGYGGTNGHAILDDAASYLKARGVEHLARTQVQLDEKSLQPASSEEDKPETASEPLLFVVSAPEQNGLLRLSQAQADYLKTSSGSQAGSLEELAFTYSQRRSVFQWRSAVVASEYEELALALSDVKNGVRAGKTPGIMLCFTGQGAQWATMGQALRKYDVFRSSLERAAQHFEGLSASFKLDEELYGPNAAANINAPSRAQPLCTAIQVALVDLLASWNVRPRSVIGHSSGEIGAAYAQGALSAEDCYTIAFHRGRLAGDLATIKPELKGSMMAVGLSRQETQDHIDALNIPAEQTLNVACVNSNESVTVAGDVASLTALEEKLVAEKVFARRLQVQNAYHSKHMTHIAEDYLQSLQEIRTQEGHPDVTMFSSVTGGVVKSNEVDASYWVQNMVQPVLFLEAMRSAFQAAKGAGRRRGPAASIDVILELGPHAALGGPIKQILSELKMGSEVTYTSALVRKQCAHRSAIAAMGKLWCAGVDVDLGRVNVFTASPARLTPRTDLPKYPWNHNTRYWHESAQSAGHRFRHSARTDLLGEPVAEFSWATPVWKNFIRVSELPWVADHTVRGNDVYPAAAMICAAIEGAQQCANSKAKIASYQLTDVLVDRALIIPAADPGVLVFTRFVPRDRDASGVVTKWGFTFSSQQRTGKSASPETQHCSGEIQVLYEARVDSETPELPYLDTVARGLTDKIAYEEASKLCVEPVSAEEHYDATSRIGITYGPTFQGLTSIKAGEGQATFDLVLRDTKAVMPAEFEFPFVIHPTLLDAAIQSAYQGLSHDRDAAEGDTVVPVRFGKIHVSANLPTKAGDELVGFVDVKWISPKDCEATIKVGQSSWSETLLEMSDCIFMGLSDSTQATHGLAAADRKVASFEVWKPEIDLLPIRGAETSRLLGRHLESPKALSVAEAALTQAAFIYINRALKNLTPETEASLEGHWALYVQWLRERYAEAEAKKLPYQDLSSEDWLSMDTDREEEFLQSCREQYPADAPLLCAVGDHLSEIITQEQQPLELMLVDDMLTKIYADGHALASGLGMFREWFQLMGHQKPSIDILEIGAGTGSVTLPVLEGLGGRDGATPRFKSYTFTDISAGWFENAQELLKPWGSRVNFKKLDIESDPLEQGFEAESYDVISASNVLHATKRLDVTLQNCYKLLRPGGKIIIGELTFVPHHDSVIFGTLPGWWLSEDGRTGGPIISQSEWDRKLRDAQFTGLDVAVAAEDSRDTQLLSVMVSSKPSEPSGHQLKTVYVIRPANLASVTSTEIVSAVEKECERSLTEAKIVTLEEAALAADQGLLRDPNTATICLLEAEESVFASPTVQVYESVQKVLTQSGLLTWYACNTSPEGVAPPEACAISGLLRTARSENFALRLHEVHLKAREPEQMHETGQLIWTTIQKFWYANAEAEYETEVYEIDGLLCVPRLQDEKRLNRVMAAQRENLPMPEDQPLVQAGRPLKLVLAKSGKFDDLHWSDNTESKGPLDSDKVLILTVANAVTSLDAEICSTHVQSLEVGSGLVGTVVEVGSQVSGLKVGDRVAVPHSGSFRTHLVVDAGLPQRIPNKFSFEQAAGLPLYLTAAYHALHQLARIEKGQKVLITQGSSCLGRTLLVLARAAQAEIYVTVGSPERSASLQKDYGILAERIFNSNSPTLASAINRELSGTGLDLVLNTLESSQLRSLIPAMAAFGSLVDFNLANGKANIELPLHILREKGINFFSVNTPLMIRKAPAKAADCLSRAFSLLEKSEDALYEPTVYDYSDLTAALTTAQRRTSPNPAVVRFSTTSRGLAVPFDEHPLVLRDDAAYVISGGLGGVGRALACHLADHGARHIALLSRSDTVSEEAQKTVDYLNDMGVKVRVMACDVTDRESLEKTVSIIEQEVPIKGLIHGAMHLSDGLYETMSHASWTSCTKPKIEGTRNLHETMPKDLDFFVMLSSIAGICGNPGQPNYAAGNSYQDGMAHYRRSLGLAACTVDLGGISGFGWLEDNKDGNTFADKISGLMVQPHELFSAIKAAITGFTTFNNACPTQLITGIGSGGMSAANIAAGGTTEYFWLNMQGRFAFLRQLDMDVVAPRIGALSVDDSSSAKAELFAATSLSQASNIVQGMITAKLARSLMMVAADIDASLPAASYGVDSLVAAEMRNWCAQELQATVSVFDLLNAVPISTLASQIAGMSGLLSTTIDRNA